MPASAVEVKARQVILDPRSARGLRGHGDALLFPEQRRGGEPDPAIWSAISRKVSPGWRVRNETPEGNTIQTIALADDAKTYKIGDTIGIALTFAEAVNVSGAPTLALEIGSASRKAALVRGSGSAVLTFEYSVVESDEDANGIAIEANGLAVPAGASIVDTVGRRSGDLALYPVRRSRTTRLTACARSPLPIPRSVRGRG